MQFSTVLTMALTAFPLAFANTATGQQARVVANFWSEPNKGGSVGFINEDNLNRCIDVSGENGSAEVVDYGDRAFYCNLYSNPDCSGPWETEIDDYRPDLHAEGLNIRGAKCSEYNQ